MAVAPAPFEEQPAAVPGARRDVSLDLLRGLAMVVLVINHLHLHSALEYATEPFLSAAEALVAVSGVVVGMVFGRRWLTHGARATTAALLRRSRQLYVASVCVVALVGVLRLVPGLATEALAVPPGGGADAYAFDGPARTVLAMLTLEAGPWQFNILGFFIAVLALAPAVLWALDRGLWPVVLATSWGVFAVGRTTGADVLPAQSEGPFPLLIWQVLFVHGAVLGWHRAEVGRLVARARGVVVGLILAVAAVAAYVRLHELGLEPPGLGALLGADPSGWDAQHFDKATLDAARLVSMVAFTAAAYVLLRRFEPLAERTVGRLLLPLGRNSFYVFIMHVFVCLALASVPMLAANGLGLAANAAVQLGCLALVWAMVRRRFMFRWVPR